MLEASRLRSGALFAELQRIGVANQGDFQVRRIAGPELLGNYVRLMQAVPHRDSHPVVALQAPKARFLRSRAGFLQYIADCGMPVSGLLDGLLPPAFSDSVVSCTHSEVTKRELAYELSASMMMLWRSRRGGVPVLSSFHLRHPYVLMLRPCGHLSGPAPFEPSPLLVATLNFRHQSAPRKKDPEHKPGALPLSRDIAAPYRSVRTNSTRRLAARPASVVLSATGRSSP